MFASTRKVVAYLIKHSAVIISGADMIKISWLGEGWGGGGQFTLIAKISWINIATDKVAGRYLVMPGANSLIQCHL